MTDNEIEMWCLYQTLSMSTLKFSSAFDKAGGTFHRYLDALIDEMERLAYKKALYIEGCDDQISRSAIAAMFDADIDYAFEVATQRGDIETALWRLRQHA